jgi:hypothetical protein
MVEYKNRSPKLPENAEGHASEHVEVTRTCLRLEIIAENIIFPINATIFYYFIYLYSVHYMFRPQMDHLQVLEVSHILLPNSNAKVPIFINSSHKLISLQFTN